MRPPLALLRTEDTGVSFQFTPWQRLFLAFQVCLPFDLQTSVDVDVPTLHELARYRPMEAKRQIPISCECTLGKGCIPDVTILNLPPAAGKTALSCALAGMIISTHWHRLLDEYKAKTSGCIVQGGATHVARLVLVGAGAATFEHFAKTLRRLVPTFGRFFPSTPMVVWSTMSKHHSVAAADPEALTFWVVPMKEINKVLRAHPTHQVAVCIEDELIGDTSRERSITFKSTILKRIIPQATPQALTTATKGQASWIKGFFGGELHPPSMIGDLIRFRQFTNATKAVEQLAKLDLCTTTVFRPFVSRDLASLMPPGMRVYPVRSRIQCMAAHLANLDSDMVPASLVNVVLNYLNGFLLSSESRLAIHAQLRNPVLHPEELAVTLEQAQSTRRDMDRSRLTRLAAKVRDFATECPICYSAPTEQGLRLYGCCGYCVCEECFHNNRTTTCPFCRTAVPSAIPRAAVETEPEEETVNAPIPVGESLEADLAQHTSQNNRIFDNLLATLKVMRTHQYKRTILVVQTPSYSTNNLDVFLNQSSVEQETGFELFRVDDLMGGKGTRFARVKQRFDSPDPTPMALVCFGIDARFVVGTDLGMADSVVTVGSVDEKLVTQTVFRSFRPMPMRDPTKYIAFVKIVAVRSRR